MMFVDTHCHLNKLDLDCYRISEGHQQETYTQLLQRALKAANAEGVEQFLCVAIDLEDVDEVVALAKAHEAIYATVGVHPLYQSKQQASKCSVGEALVTDDELSVDQLIAKVRDANSVQRVVVAIGETGLDYHYCPEQPQWQKHRFEVHLQAAIETRLPVIIHSRSAKQVTLDLFRKYEISRVGGIMHCFTEDLDMAKQCIDMGFFISLSGILTFNNASPLREVAKALPLENLLIETDSPYLAPKPHRGKSNEPKWVVEVAKQLAEIKGIPLERIAEVTTDNYQRFLALSE